VEEEGFKLFEANEDVLLIYFSHGIRGLNDTADVTMQKLPKLRSPSKADICYQILDMADGP
jgi:hypothetical protein